MKELRKWEFQKELIDLSENCTKLKPSTAKAKARKLFNKYDDIIAYYGSYISDLDNRVKNQRDAIEALKSGIINYNNGSFKIADVSYYNCSDTRITVMFNNGKEMYFDFSFKGLFNLVFKA